MTRRFKTRYQAYNLAKHVWQCKHCKCWHRIKPKKYCSICKHTEFYYFASEVEANYFAELSLLENAGLIMDLKTQVDLPLIVNDIKICSYIADFTFIDTQGLNIHDVKANIDDKYLSPEFKIKRKLVKALYGVDVELIKRRS